VFKFELHSSLSPHFNNLNDSSHQDLPTNKHENTTATSKRISDKSSALSLPRKVHKSMELIELIDCQKDM
jgi:hypothetical protein